MLSRNNRHKHTFYISCETRLNEDIILDVFDRKQKLKEKKKMCWMEQNRVG